MASVERNAEAALLRWRLVIGEPGGGACWNSANASIEGNAQLSAIDRALDFLYGEAERSAGLGGSSPYLPTWLGDIRRYFPSDVVGFLQAEAIERKNLKQLLLEPETLGSLERDIGLAATIIGFKDMMPEQTKATARVVIEEIVDDLRKRLELSIRQAIIGALQRNRHSPMPVARNLDVHRTIRDGLKNYDQGLGKVIPDRIHFFSNQQRYHEWRIIVLVDQSGSMGESVVYSSVFAAVFASLPALDARLVLFDTNVVDVSDALTDPVELLFGVQLGGGTDIAHALTYGASLVEQPEKTIFLLITDLYEGGNKHAMLQQLAALKENHVKVLCVLALNDKGVASFDRDLGRKVAALDIPTFAATPSMLTDAVEKAIKGETYDAGTL